MAVSVALWCVAVLLGTAVFGVAAARRPWARAIVYGVSLIVSAVVLVYIHVGYDALVTKRPFLPNTLDVWIAIAFVLVVLYAALKEWGVVIPILGLVGLAYGYFGYLIPGDILFHSGIPFQQLVAYTSIPFFTGMFGGLTELSVGTIFMFMLFGAVLEVTGGVNFILQIAYAISGRSNGGLLMGAALTQHPELYRAVASGVGIYDMLRTELSPNGAFNVTEFGTVKERAQFDALYAYSPLHRVKDGTAYPAVLLTTGENDGRVDPYNSRKMAARLQAATTSQRPVLLRVSPDAGHAQATSLSTRIEEYADTYAFLMGQLGMK